MTALRASKATTKQLGQEAGRGEQPSFQRRASQGRWADFLAWQRTAGNRAVNRSLDSTADSRGTVTGGVPPIVQRALSSGRGRPLDASTRTLMESRFGRDFGHVRTYADTRAADAARAAGAAAFTIGDDVVFGADQYSPATDAGQQLIAHELAHVVQQDRGGAAPGPSTINALERSADQAVADIFSSSTPIQVSGASSPYPARQTSGQARAATSKKRGRVAASIEMLKLAERYALVDNDLERSQKALANMELFVSSIVTESNTRAKFRHLSLTGRFGAEQLTSGAVSAIHLLRSWFKIGGKPSPGQWKHQVQAYVAARPWLEMLADDVPPEKSEVQALEKYAKPLETSVVISSLILVGIGAAPVAAEGAVVAGRTALAASSKLLTLATAHHATSVTVGELVGGKILEIVGFGQVGLHPGEILLLLITVRGARVSTRGKVLPGNRVELLEDAQPVAPAQPSLPAPGKASASKATAPALKAAPAPVPALEAPAAPAVTAAPAAVPTPEAPAPAVKTAPTPTPAKPTPAAAPVKAPSASPTAATPVASAPAAALQGQATAGQAKLVWVNPKSKIYHPAGSYRAGTTQTGAWMTEADAQAAGYRPAKRPERTGATAVAQEAGRLQEKVISDVTKWPKNERAHPTSSGSRKPDYLVKKDPQSGAWVTADNPEEAQFVADSKYYDETVIGLTDQVKGFIELAAKTKPPSGQKFLIFMTNTGATISPSVIKWADARGVNVRQIFQYRSK